MDDTARYYRSTKDVRPAFHRLSRESGPSKNGRGVSVSRRSFLKVVCVSAAAYSIPAGRAYGAGGRSILEFGAQLNNAAAAARAANSAAIKSSIAALGYAYIPKGVCWINPGIELAAGAVLYGDSQFVGGSLIRGDGDLFLISSAGGEDTRAFRDLDIANDNDNPGGYGVLVHGIFDKPITRMQFQNCRFGNASIHILGEGSDLVDWTVRDCRFEYSSTCSRVFDGAIMHKEYGVYTAYNNKGLSMRGGVTVLQMYLSAGVFEQSQQEGIEILAAGSNVFNVRLDDIHFESNGIASGAPDVALIARTPNRIANVVMDSCGFYGQTPSQNVRVKLSGEDGAISKVIIRSPVVQGTAPLADIQRVRIEDQTNI